MFRLFDLNSLAFDNISERVVLYVVMEKALFEKSNVVKIEQTYISRNYGISTKTVQRSLKTLSEKHYLTAQRGYYKNLTTTEIKLSDAIMELLKPHISANKPQGITVTHEQRKLLTNSKKTLENGLNEAAETLSDHNRESVEKTLENGLNEVTEALNSHEKESVEFDRIEREIKSLKPMQISVLSSIMSSKSSKPIVLT